MAKGTPAQGDTLGGPITGGQSRVRSSRADDNGWCGAGTFSGGPGLPGRRPDQALRDRPMGLVRSLLQIRQTLGPGDVDVEVLDVDVDLVRRRGWRLSSPDCPG